MKKQEEQLSVHITENTPLKPAIQAWRYYLEDQGCSIYTIKAFLSDLGLLASFLPPDRCLKDIHTVDLNHFLDWLENKRGVPCSPKSLSRRITSIKSFFNWLHRYQAISHNPAEAIIQRSVISPLPIILTDDEVTRLVDAALHFHTANKPDSRYYTLIQLLLITGIKKNECLGIYLNHIDTSNPQEPFVFIRYANPQYRYKERKIPLTPEWIEASKEYIHQYNIKDQLFPWTARRLEYLLEDLAREAAVEKHVSFDMCRWTSAVQDWRKGMPSDQLRQKLGLSKIQWREVSMKLALLANS